MTTGLKTGDFTSLRVYSDGDMKDILAVVTEAVAAGGGGSGVVIGVSPPLNLTSGGLLSVDLSSYSTVVSVQALLTNYSLTSSLLAQMTTNILTLRDGIGVDRNLQGSQTGTLVFDGQAIATSNDLVNKIDTLVAGPGITLTGAGSSRTIQANLAQINLVAPLFTSSVGTNSVTIESHWKPSNVTAGSGIFCLANDAAGTLNISATGSGVGQTEAQVKALIGGGVTSNDALGRLNTSTSVSNGTVAFAINDTAWNSKQDAIPGMSGNPTGTGQGVIIEGQSYPNPTLICKSTQATAGGKIEFQASTGSIDGVFFIEGTNSVGRNLRFQSNGSSLTFHNAGGGYFYMVNQTMSITGSLAVSSSFSASSKSFVIPHPDTTKVADEGKAWKLRHHCIESDKPYLQYRETIAMTNTMQSLKMPESWFPHLVSDVCVHMSPFQHFGSGWGQLQDDGCSLDLHVTTLGTWHVQVTGIRKDPCGLECRAMPTEYQEEVPQKS
jgi:hypothetical protein